MLPVSVRAAEHCHHVEMPENKDVAAFVHDVRKAFDVREPESFWNCESAFARLLLSSFLESAVNEQLQGLLRDPGLPVGWIANELVLHRGGGFALSASLFETSQRYIHSLPYHAMYAPIGAVGLSCDIYILPKEYRNAVFDPSLALTFERTHTTPPNNAVLLRSGRHAYDFRVDRPTVVVKFMTTALDSLEWLFSRNGLQAWQANDTDLSFTQLRVAADVLGQLAHQSSLGALKRLARHHHHAVRWAAIQNIGRLSRSDAIAELRQAINDRHPHIQRAARKTLEQLKAV